jgi:uncharacterized membrane protein
MTRWAVRRRFTSTVLDRIEASIAAAEATHCGEIELIVETDLDAAAILAGKRPRQRALELFSAAHVWDTEANNGVLIYVLYADRAVEIVADRGFNTLVTPAEWASVCARMQTEFRAGRWADGAIAGVAGVAELVARHFPETGQVGNELPDRPVLL